MKSQIWLLCTFALCFSMGANGAAAIHQNDEHHQNPSNANNANANVAIKNTNNITTGAQGGAGGKGGEASSHAEASGGNANVKDVGNVTGSGISTVTITNPNPLPPAPGVVVPNAIAPTLYYSNGMTANEQSVDIVLRYLEACPSTFTPGDNHKEIRQKGNSGYTSVIWTPHSTYARNSNNDDIKTYDIVKIPKGAKVGEFRYVCLGILQIEGLPDKAAGAPEQSIQNDAMYFIENNLKGFRDLHAVLFPGRESISVNKGNISVGNGLGVSPGLAGMLSPVNALATLAGGFSTNRGSTFPATQVGTTFIIVTKEEGYPNSVPRIDFAEPEVSNTADEQRGAILKDLAVAQAEAIAQKQEAIELKIALRQAEIERDMAKMPTIKPMQKKRIKKPTCNCKDSK